MIVKKKHCYEEKFIAFIDILGFKDLIIRRGDEIIGQLVDTIKKSMAVYKERFVPDPSVPDTDSMGYKVLHIDPTYYLLSDSIILTMKDAENNLFRLLLGIIAIQKVFIKDNIFVRGAIVKGGIFESEDYHGSGNMVFGPGGIEAIQMEADYSIYPRIIVSESVLGSLKQKYLEAEEKSPPAKDLFRFILLRDKNGTCFIDYLTFEVLLPLISRGDSSFFDTHKTNILKQLRASEDLKGQEKYKARTKYLLLSEYHDFVVNENKEYLSCPQAKSIGIRIKGKENKFFSRPF